MFDENGERKDKFKTKAADPNNGQAYIVRCMAFSPDSTKLALAQSDDIVFIYRLGSEWGEKKSICNKFQQTASVTSMVWPRGRENEVIFALADGKVGVLATSHCIAGRVQLPSLPLPLTTLMVMSIQLTYLAAPSSWTVCARPKDQCMHTLQHDRLSDFCPSYAVFSGLCAGEMWCPEDQQTIDAV